MGFSVSDVPSEFSSVSKLQRSNLYAISGKTVNLLMSVNSPNKKIRKKLLPDAVKHSATLISRQHSLSAENHRNGSSEIINRHQKMAGNAEIQ
jgi:hypothetical protein